MNAFVDILPARWRKRLYAAFGLASAVITACAAADVGLGKAPIVLAAFGAALGLTAAANTSQPAGEVFDEDQPLD